MVAPKMLPGSSGRTCWALSLAGSAMNRGTSWETRNCLACCLATCTHHRQLGVLVTMYRPLLAAAWMRLGMRSRAQLMVHAWCTMKG